MKKKLYTAEGVILKRRNYQESDRVITIFTRGYGKITAIAKGVRKVSSRRAGHLEVFTQARFVFYQGKTWDHITEVFSLAQFESFRRDLTRASFAYYACELLDYLLPDRQSHEYVYDRFIRSLQTVSMQSSVIDLQKEIYEFALHILRLLGFLPESHYVHESSIHRFVESITERKLKTVKLLSLV